MKAIVLHKRCRADQMKPSDVALPTIRPGWVLVKVMAFGINRSEIMLREGELEKPYINTPIIPGIECVGTIEDPSDSRFKKGDTVVALMGGMGRSFNGSYAEYALLPAKNIFLVRWSGSLTDLAAIPETFFTAYGSLYESLNLTKDELLLIRAGASALGIAALQLAKSSGARVIVTTRSPHKRKKLEAIGADRVILEDANLSTLVKEYAPDGVNKVLELIGPSTMKESFTLLKKGGILCQTGILGREKNFSSFDAIKDIPNGVFLSSFHSNFPSQERIDQIFTQIQAKTIKPVIATTFSLDRISKAHQLMESNEAFGKIVITIG